VIIFHSAFLPSLIYEVILDFSKTFTYLLALPKVYSFFHQRQGASILNLIMLFFMWILFGLFKVKNLFFDLLAILVNFEYPCPFIISLYLLFLIVYGEKLFHFSNRCTCFKISRFASSFV